MFCIVLINQLNYFCSPVFDIYPKVNVINPTTQELGLIYSIFKIKPDVLNSLFYWECD